MGAITSKEECDQDYFGWCIGSSRKSTLGAESNQRKRDAWALDEVRRYANDDSISLDDSTDNSTLMQVKGEETIIIETQNVEIAKLDQLLCQGVISEDDYAPKLKQIATIQDEAKQARLVRNSPFKPPKQLDD